MSNNIKEKQFFDKSYKSLFDNKLFIKSLINFALPEKIKNKINWKFLSSEKINFIPPDLGTREADRLYSVKLINEKEIYLYVLLEFKSTPDKITPLLLYIYTALIYHHLLKIGKIDRNNPEIPIIIPIVLYIGDRRWKVVKRLRELMDEEAYKSIREYVPDLRYILIDKHKYSEKELEEMRGIISGLLYIEKINNKDIVKKVERYGEIFLKGIGDSERRILISYIINMIRHRFNKKIKKGDIEKIKEGNKMFATALDEWREELIQKGMQEGIQKGMRKGIRKGMQEGITETARRMLEKGYDIQEISNITGLTPTQLKKLKDKLKRLN